MDELRLEQQQPEKSKHEFGKRKLKKIGQHIAQILTGKLRGKWIVENGKVKTDRRALANSTSTP
jgi:hypothetical protein